MMQRLKPDSEGLPEPALVAVSGGRDSVVLLHWLVQQDEHSLIVCHLNHGLRGQESGQDAAFVRRLAKRYGLPCELDKVDVRELAHQRRLSLEAAAREARHEFFARVAEKSGVRTVFLAHHADDQAETVVANVGRGSGLAGLAGMKPRQELRNGLILLRPLLNWRRADIDAYLEEHRLSHREDSSNRSDAHRRNRLRHEVLPRWSQALDRDVTPALLRLAAQAARDDDCLERITSDWLQANPVIEPDGRLRLTKAFKALHPALLTRVVRRWFRSQAVADLDHALMDSALLTLTPDGPAKINLPGNRHLRRKGGYWFIEQGAVVP